MLDRARIPTRSNVLGFVLGLLLVHSVTLSGELAFEDRAAAAGVSSPGFGRGAGMADLDRDGALDLIASNAGMANGFFRQLPDHSFTEANDLWGIEFDDRESWGVLVADFDNDGDSDVYFLNGGFSRSEPNQLLRNDLEGLGIFTDVSELGADAGAVKTFGATTLDFDRDGHLDIFLATNEELPCTLLRNEGNLVFRNVSDEANLVEPGKYRHTSSGDFNNDGWMDLAVGNFGGPNRLYRNNGDGTFDEIATAAGVASPGPNFGMVLEDFDNDGWMDIYIPKWDPDEPETSGLFRNRGDGTFEDISEQSGMTGQTDMGHNAGDLDGDGYPDIFIGTGSPELAHDDRLFLITPSAEGGLVATDVSDPSLITSGGPTRCHGSAFGDFDQDGFVDIYANNGGPSESPDTLEENALWRNLGSERGWLGLKLTGIVSNRSAVGARCVARLTSGRQVHRMLRIGSGFANSDSPIVHFGVLPSEKIERIDILWPSGVVQVVLDPPMNRIFEVIEFDPSWALFGDAFESGDLSSWSTTMHPLDRGE